MMSRMRLIKASGAASRFRGGNAALSMIEVVVALGIAAFALIAVLALLPTGLKSNQISAEETRAVNLLSLVESDLRNTHPLASANGRSALMGLTLPYAANSSGTLTFNPALTDPTTNLGAGSTTGVDEAEKSVPLSDRPPFQVSVVYLTAAPSPGSPGNLLARLVVNWPAVPGTQVSDLTGPRTRGFVEAFVSFPAP